MNERISEAHYGILNFGDAQNPRIVLIQDADKPLPHFWKLPGGTLEAKDEEKESPRDACIEREMLEEAGVAVSSTGILFQKRIERPTPHLFIVHALDAQGAREEDLKKGEEIFAIKVFDRKAVETEIGFNGVLGKHAEAILEWLRTSCS